MVVGVVFRDEVGRGLSEAVRQWGSGSARFRARFRARSSAVAGLNREGAKSASSITQ
jgi:hypothetical protein